MGGGGGSGGGAQAATPPPPSRVTVSRGLAKRSGTFRDVYAQVSRAQLDRAVARVLKGRFQTGQFDPAGTTPWDALGPDVVYSAAHQRLSLEGAQQSVVLLRNPAHSAARLPLRRGLALAVIGPNGNVADVFQGQYHGANCPGTGPAPPSCSCPRPRHRPCSCLCRAHAPGPRSAA